MREVGDLYLTAMLRLRGHSPVNVTGNGRRAYWVFDASAEIDADVHGYYDGSLSVSARDFAEAIRSAKGEALSVASRGREL